MKLSTLWKIVLGLVGLGILAFLSFQYARITQFPTGNDPAAHIRLIRISTYQDLFKSNYPLPEAIFKFLHNTFPVELPRLFTLTIAGFFCLSTFFYLLFSKKISSSYLIAFVAATIFSTGAWVADGLRMGILPESFGWGILLLALTALVVQNIPLVILSAGLLAFAHPFSFTIYALVAVMYLSILAFGKEKKERRFSLITSGLFILVIVAALLFIPGLIDRFIGFINPEAAGWGERSLGAVLTVNEPRRILVAIFTLIGLVASLKNWSKPGIKISYLLLFVGLFMSMNQIFGIQFLVFRFYPYMEMGLAIFAALGILYFIEKMKLEKYRIPSVLVLTAIIIVPHYISNGVSTNSQANDPSMDKSATVGDRAAIEWIDQNVPHNALINAEHGKAIWIRAITDSANVFEDPIPLDLAKSEEFYKNGGTFVYNYIYFANGVVVPLQVSNNYKLVYDQDGVKIYQK